LIYCTVFNPALEIIYLTQELHPGATMADIPMEVTPTGNGINVARVVRTLGEEVCVLGILPENDILDFSKYMGTMCIKGCFIPVEGAVRINTTLYEKKSGSITRIQTPDYRWPSRIHDKFISFAEEYMHPGDLWALSGAIPRGFDPDIYAHIIKKCKKKNISVVLDSCGIGFNMGVRAKPKMIKPNLDELESFFGEHIQGVHHIALKGKRLLDLGIEYVFISLGSDGMIAIHENDCLLCSAPQVDVIDTNGCGDALIAGFMVAFSRNFSFMESCRMAVACGTSNTLHPGAGKVENEEIWRLMEDVHIEAV
jgi:1-phosphofructokinase family hexose kinase